MLNPVSSDWLGIWHKPGAQAPLLTDRSALLCVGVYAHKWIMHMFSLTKPVEEAQFLPPFSEEENGGSQ